MPNNPYDFMNLPGCREVSAEADAEFVEVVEKELVKLLADQEREKEEEEAKLANLTSD
jgi:hypothetical protein